MTPAIHKFVSNFDIAVGSCERNCSSIGFCRIVLVGGIHASRGLVAFLIEIIMN